MGKVKKLSVSVDEQTLDELRRLVPHLTVSFLVDDALRQQLARAQLTKVLDELEALHPPTPEEKAEGERLWREAVSSSIQVRSRRSPQATVQPSPPSGKRSKTKVKSSSRAS